MSRPPCALHNAVKLHQEHIPSLFPSPRTHLLSLFYVFFLLPLHLLLSLVEFKKSYENDSQSSDNVNFLRVGWSNKQLTTLKPLLSEIEYLQDQHLLLTVKSLDGYESYGLLEIVLFVLHLSYVTVMFIVLFLSWHMPCVVEFLFFFYQGSVC